MSAMQFWGVEVRGKEQHRVPVDGASIIHVSQATLGDIKKDNETVTVHVEIGGKKLVLGMLSQKNPHLSFDLVFDDDFVISHNWKNGSIHLMGYIAETADSELDLSDSEEEDEEVLPVAQENGTFSMPAPKALAGKPKEDNKAKAVAKDDSEDDDSSDDEDEDSDDDADEVMVIGDSDSDDESGSDDDDDSEESEEEKPVEVAVSGKKRSTAEAKSSPNAKKAKIIATPQKTDGKKGVVHPATPHPNKKGAKTPGGEKSAKSDAKTPQSGGSASDHSCGPCKKTFKSESAFQSHTKAKHSAK